MKTIRQNQGENEFEVNFSHFFDIFAVKLFFQIEKERAERIWKGLAVVPGPLPGIYFILLLNISRPIYIRQPLLLIQGHKQIYI